MTEGGELIYFKAPREDSTLFVSHLDAATTEEDLQKRFSLFGKIHSLRIFERDPNPMTQTQETMGNKLKFAFVKYYAVLHAKQAHRELSGVEIHGRRMKISFAKKRPGEPSKTDYELSIERCIDLANNFIGYNKWSSSIVSMERLDLTQRDGKFEAKFSCTVRHILRENGIYVEGTGEGSELNETMGTALDFSKKKAVTAARKDAFSKMIIVLLNSGKVYVHMVGASLPQPTANVEESEDREIYSENGPNKRRKLEPTHSNK